MVRILLFTLFLTFPSLLAGNMDWESLHTDDPYHDYLVSMGLGENVTGHMTWDLTQLVPDHGEFDLIVLHVAVTPVGPNRVGLGYLTFDDAHGNRLTHIMSCWSTAGFGKITGGMGGQVFAPRADTISPKKFKILSPRLRFVSESIEGGLLIRLLHEPLEARAEKWKQYALPAYGAWDELHDGSTWTENWLGFTGQFVQTTSAVETDLIRVNLGEPRAVSMIAGRVGWWANSKTPGAQIKCYWSPNMREWHEYFSASDPEILSQGEGIGYDREGSIEYPAVRFRVPTTVQGVKCTGRSDGSDSVSMRPYKVFAWGK